MSKAIECYDEHEYDGYMTKAILDKAILTLAGIAQGISIDSVVDDLEIKELANWVIVHSKFEKYKPFDEIVPLVKDALSDGKITQDEIDDILYVCSQFSEGGKFYNISTLSIQLLHGICHGLLANGELTDEEIRALNEWIYDNEILKGTYPYDEIEALCTNILSDGVITELERMDLKAFISEFVDCTASYNISQAELDELKKSCNITGICSVDPVIEFKGNLFCFTGGSSRTTRSDIEIIINKHGGIFKNNVVKDTKYLVVGNEGNECWAFSCYGRKVEKAMDMRKHGASIIVVHENDFWDVIG